jgi:AraC-like DNA-binding protein
MARLDTSVCELTPLEYLRLRRHRHARGLLRDGTPGSTTVKAAAYSAGFFELDRFAVDSRRHFGESPRDTRVRGAWTINKPWGDGAGPSFSPAPGASSRRRLRRSQAKKGRKIGRRKIQEGSGA